jgi:hypothetical protein
MRIKEDTLPGMGNDPKPGTAKIPARQSEEEYSANYTAKDAPRLVKVIDCK